MAKRFGMNIAGPGENMESTYADALRQHRGWCRTVRSYEPDPNIPVDRHGEPLADFAFCGPVKAPFAVPYLAGTYELSFVGQANVEVEKGVGAASITRIGYDQAANTTTALIVVPASNDNGLSVKFTKTRRQPTDRPGTGLSRIKLMRPITVGSTRYHRRKELFNREWLAVLRDCELIRGMDWLGTNGYGLKDSYLNATWAARTYPGYANQYPIKGRVGACLEDLIEAANLANVDLYVNIPDTADDDYITKLMQLVAFGGDGLNPYTAPEPRARYRGLKPGLKFYFAWSNEVWNAMFSQFTRNAEASLAEGTAGGSPLNFDGEPDRWVWARRRVGDRLRLCSEIARKVFGDASMMTRVRPILEAFIMDSNTLTIPLDYLNKFYNNGDGANHVANPHPPSYYVWGGGGAGYRNPVNKAVTGNSKTANEIFASGLEPMSHANEVKILAGYGLEHASYEMGFDIGEAAFNPFTNKLTSDPRSRALARKTLTDYYADGGSLAIVYHLSIGNWRVLDTLGNLNHPKYLGLKDARANPPAEAINIPAVPPSEPNPAFHGKFKLGDLLFSKGYRFPTGGYLTYTLKGYQSAEAGKPAITALVDGHPTATGELISDRFGGTSAETRPIVVPVGPGLHSIGLVVAAPITILFGQSGQMTFSPAPPPTVDREVIASARFEGPAGTALPKLAEAARWFKQFGTNDFVATGDGGLRIAGSGFGNEIAHYFNTAPPSPDYEVAATLDLAKPGGNRFFLTVRAGASPGDNGYCGGVADNQFQIYNHTANAVLAASGGNLTDFSGTVKLRLRAAGPLIQLFVNDFEVCRAADAKYTQAGFGGFYFANNAPSPTVIRSFEMATFTSTPSNLAASTVRLEPGSSNVTLVAGRPQTMALKVTPPSGFQGTMTLKLDDLPGVVAGFDPPTLTGAGTSTLTLIPADATRFAPRPLLISALVGPASTTFTGSVQSDRTPPANPAKVGLFVPPGIVGVRSQGEVSWLSDAPPTNDVEATLHFTGAIVPDSVIIPAGAAFAPFDCTPTAPSITGAVALGDLTAWTTTRQVAFESPERPKRLQTDDSGSC